LELFLMFVKASAGAVHLSVCSARSRMSAWLVILLSVGRWALAFAIAVHCRNRS
jgi:hypothetical protein